MRQPSGHDADVDFDRMLDLLRALREHAVDYVLVGAVALNLHGLIRATEDVDLFVRAEADNIERLRVALRTVWDDPAIDEITAEDLAGDYPVVRYGPPTETFVVDVLSRLGEAIGYDDLDVAEIDVEGTTVRVATPETLYRMKKETARPIDRSDADVLMQMFEIEDD